MLMKQILNLEPANDNWPTLIDPRPLDAAIKATDEAIKAMNEAMDRVDALLLKLEKGGYNDDENGNQAGNIL